MHINKNKEGFQLMEFIYSFNNYLITLIDKY
jgi:hypothetical protein